MNESMNRTRVAVIGAGQNSQRNHLPMLKRLQEEGWCHLQLICDINSDVAKKSAYDFGFQEHSGDAEKIFSRDDIDAVYVFGTVQMHHRYTMQALAANKHVFVEKPPTPDLQTALAAAALAREKKKIFAVGFNRRFYVSLNEIKNRIEGKMQIYSLEGVYHKPFLGETYMHGSSSWISYSAIHGVDAACYLMGSLGLPSALYSAWNIASGTTPQNLSAVLTWDNGAHAVISSNNSAGSRMERYTLHGYGASYSATETELKVFTQDGREESFAYAEQRTSRGFYAEHKEFFEAIRGEKTARHSMENALPLLALIDLMEKGYCGKIDWEALIGRKEEVENYAPTNANRVAIQHAGVFVSVQEKSKDAAILVLNPTALKGTLAQIADKHRLVSYEDLTSLSPAEKGKIRAIITGPGGGPVTVEMLEMLPDLQVVGVIGASVKKYNPIPIVEKNIPIINASDVFAEAVAEFTLMQALIGIKNASLSHDVMRTGGWGVYQERGMRKYLALMRKSLLQESFKLVQPLARHVWKKLKGKLPSTADMMRAPQTAAGKNLRGLTVGVIGYGAIAREFIRLLQPFACEVRIFSEFLTQEDATKIGAKIGTLAEVLAADIVSLHRGLSDRTRHSFGKDEIALLRSGTILINTSRGPIIDEPALIARLKLGDIFACLDVFEEEPLPKNSPLRMLPNVFLTSHISGVTKQTFGNAPTVVVKKVLAYLDGEKLDHLITSKQMLDNMT